MLTQKVISLLLVTMLVLSAAVCPCVPMPVAAAVSVATNHHGHALASGASATGFAKHSIDSSADKGQAHCSHLDCLGDCEAVIAARPIDLAATGLARSVDVDDFVMVTARSQPAVAPPPTILSIGLFFTSNPRPVDSPVQRYDRLLV